MDGKVTSSSITNNNPGTDFTNQLKQFENNEDMSEKNIRNKDFYYKQLYFFFGFNTGPVYHLRVVEQKLSFAQQNLCFVLNLLS